MNHSNFTYRIKRRLRNWLFEDEKRFQRNDFINLQRSVLELNNVSELKKSFGWHQDAILDDPIIHGYDYLEDANERRIRDAETLGTVVRNAEAKICLEIGTANGHTTAMMAVNAPQATIFTVNIPPEELNAGEGGILTTYAPDRATIGAYYRERGLTNIKQIFANTAHWEPVMGPIDVAFVDGCHDADFVFNDTRKILPRMKPGGFIIWHDFNPSLIHKFNWIHSVCSGVERLYGAGLLTGRILHMRDSWMGVYRIPTIPPSGPGEVSA